MNSDKINIADLQQLNVSTLTTIRDAFNSAESLDMAEFVEVLKLAHEKEFQKLKDAIGANDLINADQIQDNLRNLMMTNPGERLGRPDYGAGLRELTMEMLATDDFESILMNRIKMTVDKYLPIVELSNFTLEDITTDAYVLQSSMAKVEVIIDYNVPKFQLLNKKLAITLFVAG